MAAAQRTIAPRANITFPSRSIMPVSQEVEKEQTTPGIGQARTGGNGDTVSPAPPHTLRQSCAHDGGDDKDHDSPDETQPVLGCGEEHTRRDEGRDPDDQWTRRGLGCQGRRCAVPTRNATRMRTPTTIAVPASRTTAVRWSPVEGLSDLMSSPPARYPTPAIVRPMVPNHGSRRRLGTSASTSTIGMVMLQIMCPTMKCRAL